MKKLSAAVLSIGMLTGCSAAETAVEEPPPAAEEPVVVPEKEEKKEKPKEETFGLSKKEIAAMKFVLKSGPMITHWKRCHPLKCAAKMIRL